jgi:rhodanese-related sulfurtransferase
MHQFVSFVQRHWELFAGLFVVSSLLVYTELGARRLGVKRAGPHAATVLINHENAWVLDVREESEFKGGHIVDSVHIPLSQLQSRMTELGRYNGRPVIVGCRSGHRASRAGGMLRKQGFEAVYTLEGGLLAWENANLPLTTQTKKASSKKATRNA